MKEDVQRLETCKMWLWRKVFNISWSDKVCNEDVLRCVGEERAIISVINIQHGDLVQLVIEGRVIEKRLPEGPPVGMNE